MTTQSCKTCKWFDVPLNKAGKRVVYKDHVYVCAWAQPPMVLCDSITQHPNFRVQFPRYPVVGSDGEHCPTWERKEKA